MRHVILTVAFVVLLALITPRTYAQHVEGILDCGLWIAARKTNDAAALEHFLLGLLNGISLGSNVEFWRARGLPISREQAYLWMDGYCAKNPLKEVYEGAFALMSERTGGAYSRKLPGR